MFSNNSSADYSSSQENNGKGSYKKFIISLVIALVFVASIFFVIMLVFGSNSSEDDTNGYTDGPTYDISNDDTGGDYIEISEEESLDFLKDYSISSEDIFSIESKIRDVIDEHYSGSGYDSIIYDVSGVHYSGSTEEITFTCHTDIKDKDFNVSIKLGKNSSVESVSISESSTEK